MTFDGRLIDRGAARAAAAVVPQEGGLFDGTARYNAKYGAPAAPDAAAEAALHRVAPAVAPGRSVADLSGGERQRVLAARALLRATPVLLLDEATSALDGPAEAAVLDALLASNRTALVVAHRLTAVADRADRIVVFKGGAVVAEGTHASLLASSPDYAALWRADPTGDAPAGGGG